MLFILSVCDRAHLYVPRRDTSSLYCRYTACAAVELQCTLHGTAGALHFGLGLHRLQLVSYHTQEAKVWQSPAKRSPCMTTIKMFRPFSMAWLSIRALCVSGKSDLVFGQEALSCFFFFFCQSIFACRSLKLGHFMSCISINHMSGFGCLFRAYIFKCWSPFLFSN